MGNTIPTCRRRSVTWRACLCRIPVRSRRASILRAAKTSGIRAIRGGIIARRIVRRSSACVLFRGEQACDGILNQPGLSMRISWKPCF